MASFSERWDHGLSRNSSASWWMNHVASSVVASSVFRRRIRPQSNGPGPSPEPAVAPGTTQPATMYTSRTGGRRGRPTEGGSKLTAEQLPSVVENLRRTADVAALVNSAVLSPQDELATTWRP